MACLAVPHTAATDHEEASEENGGGYVMTSKVWEGLPETRKLDREGQEDKRC
jgi:hypothetical protein